MPNDWTALLNEARAAIAVMGDIGADSLREDAEQKAQALLALATEAVDAARRAAMPHKIELQYHGHTLRYPEDSAAGYQLLEEIGAEYPSMRNYLENLKARIRPVFITDEIWESSSNCSDQGLALFDGDDFVTRRW